MSHECNDFIIKNGKFIRDFDGMYRAIEDPWKQERLIEKDLLNHTLVETMRHLKAIGKVAPKSILNIGCATGYETDYLSGLFNSESMLGTDVSQAAIEKCQKKDFSSLSSNVTFEVDNIVKPNPSYCEKFDLVFSSKTLYYVAPEIDQVLDNIDSYLKKNGYLVFGYNIVPNAFSKKWLDDLKLRELLLKKNYHEETFVEINRMGPEKLTIGVFKK